MTKQEIETDLAATERDIIALSNIVGGLDTFIGQPHEEDRSRFKMDRLKYQSMLSDAHKLKQKIQDALTEHDHEEFIRIVEDAQ